MKRTLALILACAALLSASACGSDGSSVLESKVEEGTTTSAAAETTTTEAAATTTAAQTTEAATEQTAGTTEATKDNATQPEKNGDGPVLTKNLQEKVENWPGQVDITMAVEQDGMKMDVRVSKFGKKLYYVMSMTDLFDMTVISDGAKQYLLDKENKQYAELTGDDKIDTDEMNFDDMEDLEKDYIGSGTATYKGASVDYEAFKYTSDDEDEDEDEDEIPVSVRFYYNASGDLVGYCQILKDGTEQAFDYKISFKENADVDLFSLPSGYTKGESETVLGNVYGKMFAALLGGMGDLTGEDSVSGE